MVSTRTGQSGSNPPATLNAPTTSYLSAPAPAATPNVPVPAPAPAAMPNAPAQNHVPLEYKTRKANLESIDKLEGLKDYDDWSHQVAMLLSALRLDTIVINGVTRSPSATAVEKEIYQTMVCDALYLLTLVVSKPIMRKISRITKPCEI